MIEMKSRFGFLLFDQFEDLDFMGPWEMLALWSQKFNGPKELILISESKGKVTSAKGLTIHTDTDFSDCPVLDYLLIPGGQGTRREVTNEKLVTFIRSQKQNCKAILSVCTGAFLLHAAGLLAGKKATTHWASLDRLREFSEVNVIEERFVNDNNIWTSAGISAGIDMALAFIAETAGEETAGNIQLQAEYYPKQIIYASNSGTLPAYLDHYTKNSESEVQNFLDNYANAVAHVEIEKITTHFHHHFTLSTQDELWHLANDDTFRLNLKKSFKGYEKLGASICKMMQFKVIEIRSNHCMVNIEWGLLNSKNKILVQFDILYCLKRIDNEWKFIFIIDHNEEANIESTMLEHENANL